MNFFQYISLNNPHEALSIFRRYSEVRVNDPEELGNLFQRLMNRLSGEEKNQLLIELAEIHPDREMFEELIETPCNNISETPLSTDPKAMANGMSAIGNFMSENEVKEIISKGNSELSQELNMMKQENQTKKIFNENIFKMVVLGIALYLIYQHIIKK